MGNWSYRFMNFMRGRYGWDQLGMFLMIASFAIEILGRIFRSSIVYYIGLGLFFWMLFRMFSRNISARVAENQKFINIRNRFANWRYFRQQKRGGRGGYQSGGYAGQQGNTYYGDFSKSHEQAARENNRASKKGGTVYCYYYCPNCKQQVRVPAGKGKVRITCPRCEHKFETYS
jgi:DNA-directed RNA polymerase subunit RPC12/RpoP